MIKKKRKGRAYYTLPHSTAIQQHAKVSKLVSYRFLPSFLFFSFLPSILPISYLPYRLLSSFLYIFFPFPLTFLFLLLLSFSFLFLPSFLPTFSHTHTYTHSHHNGRLGLLLFVLATFARWRMCERNKETLERDTEITMNQYKIMEKRW